jgi:hypothetical protein
MSPAMQALARKSNEPTARVPGHRPRDSSLPSTSAAFFSFLMTDKKFVFPSVNFAAAFGFFPSDNGGL